MYHSIELIGRLTKDIELRYTPEGLAVANMSMAVNDGYGEKKSTIWFKVSVWKETAENCAKFLSKGSLAFVRGHLSYDKETGNPTIWTGKESGKTGTSFEMVADRVVFLSSKSDKPADEGF